MIVELTEIIDAGREAGHSSERIADEVSQMVRDHRFAKAYSHPLRGRILKALAVAPASPSTLAEDWDEPLGNVSYHFRKLNQLGLIELAKITPRRGAVEHTYQLADA